MNDFLLNRSIATDLRKLMLKKATYRAYSLLHLGHICNFQNGINVHLLCCMILIEISYSLVLAIMMKNKKYHTLRTVPKFHSEYRSENKYPNTNIYMRVRLLPYLGTVTPKNISRD